MFVINEESIILFTGQPFNLLTLLVYQLKLCESFENLHWQLVFEALLVALIYLITIISFGYLTNTSIQFRSEVKNLAEN